VKEEKVLQCAITPHFKLVIDKEDGAEPEIWLLCLDYRALAKIEAEIDLDLKKIESWKDISTKHFPTIVWCCLQRFNDAVTREEVNNILNPAVQRELSDVLFELCFPGVQEAYEKTLKENDTGVTASPNVPVETPIT
jgi:hypothetical protein